MNRALKDPTDLRAGRHLRERRLALGWSQSKLAASLGVSFQQVQKYESGTNRMAGTTLFKAAKVLEVDADWLLFGCKAPQNLQVAEEPATRAPLTREEVTVLKAFHALNAEDKAAFLKMLKAKAKK